MPHDKQKHIKACNKHTLCNITSVIFLIRHRAKSTIGIVISKGKQHQYHCAKIQHHQHSHALCNLAAAEDEYPCDQPRVEI